MEHGRLLVNKRALFYQTTSRSGLLNLHVLLEGVYTVLRRTQSVGGEHCCVAKIALVELY